MKSIHKTMKEKEYVEKLLEYSKIHKCKTCDCLQDELKELVKKIKNENLKKSIEKCILTKTHPCLGCNPCEPALLIGKFLQQR